MGATLVAPAPLADDAATSSLSTTRPHQERRVTLQVPRAASDATVASRPAPKPLGGRRVASPTWERFGGTLPGPDYVVATPIGATLPVAASAGGAPQVALSSTTAVGAPRVVLVVADAGEWLQVLLPMRPNTSTGWIRRADVKLNTVGLHVVIDRAARRLQVFENDAVVLDELIAVGRNTSPTPAGQFFTTELLRPPDPGGAYGPYAITLSAYSPVYQRFGSGDGAVGIHGTNDPRSIGDDVTHGCVRLSNDAVTRLAAMLPLGTPVVIR